MTQYWPRRHSRKQTFDRTRGEGGSEIGCDARRVGNALIAPFRNDCRIRQKGLEDEAARAAMTLVAGAAQ